MADSAREAAEPGPVGEPASSDGPDGAPAPPWRSAPRRRAAVPRPQLSREVVVAAALRVVETEGGDALTMRRVAKEIGVSASSLYGYVANKEELVQLVMEQIIGEVSFPTAGGDWQELVKDFARQMFKVFQRHPGVAGLSLGRIPTGPNMLAGSERMLALLRGAGMPDQVAAFVGDIGSLYVGAYAYELEVTPMTSTEDFAALGSAWLGSLPPDQFPNTIAVADKLFAGTVEDRFEWGLDVLVRGLASYLTSPPSPEARWPQPS
ncbi:MAG TPA: TetR/AcrR family transcriptional regulator [Streptosporangiaceae bacterium]|nr:TetR/AcrR family transcriptional regulator [Streptosporangiaceae bacterium]